jgi:hypothetical protein
MTKLVQTIREKEKGMSESIINKAIKLVTSALGYTKYKNGLFNVEYSEDLVDEEDYYSFTLSISMNELGTDDGIYILPKPVLIQIDYWKDSDKLILITGEDTENDITKASLYECMFFESALVSKEENTTLQAKIAELENGIRSLEHKSFGCSLAGLSIDQAFRQGIVQAVDAAQKLITPQKYSKQPKAAGE